jgi:hypothetical protein
VFSTSDATGQNATPQIARASCPVARTGATRLPRKPMASASRGSNADARHRNPNASSRAPRGHATVSGIRFRSAARRAAAVKAFDEGVLDWFARGNDQIAIRRHAPRASPYSIPTTQPQLAGASARFVFARGSTGVSRRSTTASLRPPAWPPDRRAATSSRGKVRRG